MANWSDLKSAVASIIKTNGAQEITGQLLQNVLNNIISNVGLNSTFAGIATPDTNPGTPDGNVFYLATTAGIYSNFNGIVINSGEAVILEWKGSWVKKDSGFATKEKLSELEENTNQKLSELGSEVINTIVTTKNIYNSKNQTKGYINIDGKIVASEWYYTSEFIRLNAGQVVTISPRAYRLCEYDLKKNPITSTYISESSSPYTHTQANDGYLRVTFVMSEGKMQIEFGDTATPYEPFHYELNNISLGDFAEEEVKEITEEITENAVEELNRTLIEPSTDLIKTEIMDSIKWSQGRYKSDGSYDSSDYYKNSGKLTTRKGESFVFTSSLNIESATFWKNDVVVGSTNSVKSVTIDVDCTHVIFSFVASAAITSCIKTSALNINNATEVSYSTNYLDTTKASYGKYVRADGVMIDGDNGSLVTDFIYVKPGENLIVGDGINIKRQFRFVAAYNENRAIVPSAGGEFITTYKVPNGVYWVRLSIQGANVKSDTRINKSNALLRYEPYSKDYLPKGTMQRKLLEYNLTNQPLTTIHKNLLHSFSYRPLGKLSKAYMCLVTDDGYEGVCRYSIPTIVKGKNIPMTFAIMRGSPCLSEELLPTLKEAVSDYGCAISQHGFTRFTEYNEDQLNAFFDAEKEYFDSIGLTMTSAVCPGHNINEMVASVAGTRFGVLRTGYNGNGSEIKGYMPNKYGWYANGEKSNVKALDCFNIATESVEDRKRHIDEAIENNYLIIGFFHEWELDNDEGIYSHTELEEVIDYAIQRGIEFITLDQVTDII